MIWSFDLETALDRVSEMDAMGFLLAMSDTADRTSSQTMSSGSLRMCEFRLEV